MNKTARAAIGASLFSASYALGGWYPVEAVPETLYQVLGIKNYAVLLIASMSYALFLNGTKLIFGDMAAAKLAPRGVKSLYWRGVGKASLKGKLRRKYNVLIYITVGLMNSKKKWKVCVGYVLLLVYGFTPTVTTPGLVIALLSRRRSAQMIVIFGDLLRIYLFIWWLYSALE